MDPLVGGRQVVLVEEEDVAFGLLPDPLDAPLDEPDPPPLVESDAPPLVELESLPEPVFVESLFDESDFAVVELPAPSEPLLRESVR
ncbi:hypothetical protein [Plantactinospora sp. KLBMP9567]|uniref:hypothetical protein n=1 Tax=Plantactinospora sp. KLBMP9567 TaxID=3085900 RepID=UPI0029819330|nr:hypothetical protein [Plantactinospora sp. KLBMP9567]MDW5328781.1 hypothetical protein [Plantactinospora sp. KLBMP9567]